MESLHPAESLHPLELAHPRAPAEQATHPHAREHAAFTGTPRPGVPEINCSWLSMAEGENQIAALKTLQTRCRTCFCGPAGSTEQTIGVVAGAACALGVMTQHMRLMP